MKKLYPLLALLLVVLIAGLYGLDHYRSVREQQREQLAQLLASCVNQGLLSLFQLQANDWRERPDYYREQEGKLNDAVEALPEKILEGDSFSEWQSAVKICQRLTRHSQLQHTTIFRPLARFASREMSDVSTLKKREFLRRRLRTIDRLKISAQAADRYLLDLRMDIGNLLDNSGLSPASRERSLEEIQSQVLDYYRKGNFSKHQVKAHLQRVSRYYRLLADNPRSYSLRSGSLFFHNDKLRGEVENLNSAILQGDSAFFANWKQVLQRQQ